VLFNATKAKPTAPIARPLEEQEERESQKLWHNTAQAVKASNHVLATDEKTLIEDRQRDEAAKRLEDGVDWHPRLFRAVRGGPGGSEEGEEELDWILNANMSVYPAFDEILEADMSYSNGSTPEEQTKQILAVAPILPGQKSSEKNPIPPHTHSILPTSQPAQETVLESTENDLIDFGKDDSPASAASAAPPAIPSHFPSDLKAAQLQNNGQQQRELEKTLRSTSTSPPPENQSSILDFHNDLQTNLPSSTMKPAALKREDTDTKSLDEFVDAEG